MDFDGDGPAVSYRRRFGRWRSDGGKRVRAKAKRRQNIAILDLETDPFDHEGQSPIHPFLAIVYSSEFSTIVVWDSDWERLVQTLIDRLEQIAEPFTIYAHNGGRFDYMFFMHHLDGRCKFKGRALMSAKLGKHELRDSLHIIPESLKNANRKIEFDYRKMHRSLREKHRSEIIAYCEEDCKATFEMVRSFVDKFGMPMTIGQAAMTELKKHHSFKRLSEPSDRYLRQWFFGGRVECFAKGHFRHGPFKLFDVHSMYPSVMAHVRHPTGAEFFVNDRVTTKTAFIHLRCHNKGAFVSRLKTGELTTSQQIGEFWTTIHEFDMARSLGLIDRWNIIKTIDFLEWSDFSGFVLPLYEKREHLKQVLKANPNAYDAQAIKQDIKFYKYLLNNAYGKFAQNPRRFKEFYLTPPGERPPLDWLYAGIEVQAEREERECISQLSPQERIEHANWRHTASADELEKRKQDRIETVKRFRCLPDEETSKYTVWAIPCTEWRFNNVATAASITGAARAKLMRAIHSAVDPLYCDTDSIICRDLGGHTITASDLGTWNLEAEIGEVIIAGKKLYAYRTLGGREVIRAKGNQGVTWAQMEAIVKGQVIRQTMRAPTITRGQQQRYITRELRMTGE
jgi:hypothetical protein